MAEPVAAKGSRLNTGSVVMACVCAHEYQDKLYGKGQRVFNGKRGGYRCTICKAVK